MTDITRSSIQSIVQILKDYEFEVPEYNKYYPLPDHINLTAFTPSKSLAKVTGLVKKQDFLYTINFADGSVLKIASRHNLIDGSTDKTKLAHLFKPGDLVKNINGSKLVASTEIAGYADDFYDLSINTDEMLFVDSSGFIHHNTFTVEKILAQNGRSDGAGYTMIKGSGSALGLYKILYYNSGENNIVFIDDADGLLADQDQRNLLKAATDTKAVRKLSWLKASPGIYNPNSSKGRAIEAAKQELAMLGGKVPDKAKKTNFTEEGDEEGDEDAEGFDLDKAAEMVPNKFEFKAKVIIISNLPMNKLDPDGALRTRGIAIALDPNREELISYMVKLAKVIDVGAGEKPTDEDREIVMDAIMNTKRPSGLSIRSLVRGLDMAISMRGESPEIIKKMISRYA
jgi:hypothetical protein